jgi:hypothetical protein
VALVVQAQHQALAVPLPNMLVAAAVVATVVLVGLVLLVAVRVTLLLQMLRQELPIQAAAVGVVGITLKYQALAAQAL